MTRARKHNCANSESKCKRVRQLKTCGGGNLLSGQERLSRTDAAPLQDKEILRLEHDALVAAQNGEQKPSLMTKREFILRIATCGTALTRRPARSKRTCPSCLISPERFRSHFVTVRGSARSTFIPPLAIIGG